MVKLTDSGTPLYCQSSVKYDEKKEEKVEVTYPSRSPNQPRPTPLPNPSSSELPTRSTSGILAGPAITFLEGPGIATRGG
jgi:hypothetical protein